MLPVHHAANQPLTNQVDRSDLDGEYCNFYRAIVINMSGLFSKNDPAVPHGMPSHLHCAVAICTSSATALCSCLE